MGICAGCDDPEPLWPDGLCDGCHYERKSEIADLDDDPYDDEDDWDDEPVRTVQDVPTRGLL